MAAREVTNDPISLSATVPLTAQQRQLAIAVVAVLLVAFGITATWRAAPMPQLDAFIPCIETTIFVTDLITAALLFSQFSIIRSRALLVHASGYLFTALIVVPHMLTFPGAFSPTGLLGAGLQSTGWLYVSWHFGFPVALGVYAWLKDKESANSMQVSTRLAIGCSVAITVCVVCGFTLLATTGKELLPRLFLDRTHVAPLERYILGLNLLVIAFVLALLWTRRRSLLDQWLLVVACAWTLELAMTGLLSPTRFSLGWYAGRTFSVITATVVLIVILSEMTKLYARLARSNAALQREQNNRLMNLEAMAASISHEVRQPLAAISMYSRAAIRFLRHTPPDLEEVQSNLNAIDNDSHRAVEVFENIRALFGRASSGQETVNVNEIAVEVLGALRGELEEHGITTRTELTTELPLIMGHRGQLQEVILNLIRNAVEAMDDIKEGSRVLRVRTQHRDRDAITVAVEDTGSGIVPEKMEGIFDPFVTTKSEGMGLGLAICRMIVERHGGKLSARSDKKKGTIFQFTLPTQSAA